LALIWAASTPSQRAVAVEPTVPPPRGYVSDAAGVLDPATRRDLAALIEELKTKTGAEIAVVVVDSTAPLTAFDYAMKIAEAWKPGARGKDNGVVFLVAVKDRSMFILTGYGVEGILPDGEIRDRLVVPAFRRGDYAGGIRAGTQALAEVIATGAGVRLDAVRSRPAARPQATPLSSLLLLLVIIIVLVLASRFPVGRAMPGGSGMRRRGFDGGFGGGFGGGIGGGGGGGFGGFGGGDFGGGGAGGNW
jgi:uncharacterized protein